MRIGIDTAPDVRVHDGGTGSSDMKQALSHGVQKWLGRARRRTPEDARRDGFLYRRDGRTDGRITVRRLETSGCDTRTGTASAHGSWQDFVQIQIENRHDSDMKYI